MKTFLEKCLEGTASPDEIDDYVEEWYDSDSPLELDEYLGMTIQEYCDWLENPALLEVILLLRGQGLVWEEVRRERLSA
jgi:hypothetical protein